MNDRAAEPASTHSGVSPRAASVRASSAASPELLSNTQVASLLGGTSAPVAAGPVAVQRDGITAANLDATVKSKGWPEVFNFLNGAPMDFILGWLLSLSDAQFGEVENNMFEMTGNRPRTAIAINAVSEARKGLASQKVIDYYESRFRILDQATLPDDQRDWIRGLFGVGPQAGKVTAAGAATKPTTTGGAVAAGAAAGAAGAAGGAGGASTSGFGKGSISDAGVGTILPEMADEVAKKLWGKDSFKDLVQSYKSINVFGRSTFVSEEFGNALLKADAAARPKIEAKEGHAFTDRDWQIHGISGYQANKKTGLHPWGVAVDIDYALNPYIANEAGDVVGGVNVVDKISTPIYHRIALLMLDPPRASLIPGGGKLTYDTLAAESQAMIDYFSMKGDDAKVKAWVDKRKDVLDAAKWKTVFNEEEVPDDQRATKLAALIPDDYTNLAAGPKDTAPTKLPGGVDRPFDPKGGSAKGRDPAKGFLTIRKEVVEALRAQPNMRWGGTDFGGANGDIMHFDFGKRYNIRGTVKAIQDEQKAKAKAEAEGGGTPAPVQKLADPAAAALQRLMLQRHEEGEEDLVEDEILNPPELQRSPIPGASAPERLAGRSSRLRAETLAFVQRLAGNKAAEAAAHRLRGSRRNVDDWA